MKSKLSVIIILLMISTVLAFGQEWYQSRVIIAEVWADFPDAEFQDDLTQTLADNEAKNLAYRTKQERVNKALEDARQLALHVYSDMIFGYRFEYTPRDTRRNINEKWVLTRIASIPETDTQLYDISRDVFNNQISVIFRYDLNAEQFDWLQRWQSAEVRTSKGVGLISSVGKYQVEGKYDAMQDAYKQAIRDRLRSMLVNKPLLVTGLIKLDEQPYLTKTGSYYEAKVTISIKIDDIKEQQAY